MLFKFKFIELNENHILPLNIFQGIGCSGTVHPWQKGAIKRNLIITISGGKGMNIVITEYKAYDQNEILPLYASVGWTNYTEHPERLREGYKNSLCVLAAYSNQKLVGILRAVGDGATIVFIQDILVLPEYQRMGIGTKLIRSVMEKYHDVYQIELLTDNTEKTISFYKSAGLTPANEIGALSFIRI